MKTYITIITLSFIVCYLEITNIHIEAIVQKNIILQQETISKKISQKELNHNTQKKTIQSHDTRQKIIQKQKKIDSTPSNSQEKVSDQPQKNKDSDNTQQTLKKTHSINETLIRSQFLQLINTTRVTPVSLYKPLLKSTTLRAQEASIQWSHTRPNGTKWNTTLKNIINIQSTPHGENLAQTQVNYKSDYTDNEIIQIVNNLHQGLLKSPTHYAVMTNKNYKKVNIGIYIEKKDNYLFITIAQHYIS